jgi:hypothetical protein
MTKGHLIEEIKNTEQDIVFSENTILKENLDHSIDQLNEGVSDDLVVTKLNSFICNYILNNKFQAPMPLLKLSEFLDKYYTSDYPTIF